MQRSESASLILIWALLEPHLSECVQDWVMGGSEERGGDNGVVAKIERAETNFRSQPFVLRECQLRKSRWCT